MTYTLVNPSVNQLEKKITIFIFVCRETSHKTLYEWLEFLEKSGEVKTLEKKEWNGRKELIYRYRYTNKIPLKDGEDSLQVNWCELTVINQITEENYLSKQLDYQSLH